MNYPEKYKSYFSKNFDKNGYTNTLYTPKKDGIA